ncbi:hypothetical protein [Actinoplanes sp. NPDC048796]|uniref:hypothetical protein n=1 Tax=Actinoplanes sp. NPDC048796 TaxID=3155640 RepID=UPI0033C6AAB1
MSELSELKEVYRDGNYQSIEEPEPHAHRFSELLEREPFNREIVAHGIWGSNLLESVRLLTAQEDEMAKMLEREGRQIILETRQKIHYSSNTLRGVRQSGGSSIRDLKNVGADAAYNSYDDWIEERNNGGGHQLGGAEADFERLVEAGLKASLAQRYGVGNCDEHADSVLTSAVHALGKSGIAVNRIDHHAADHAVVVLGTMNTRYARVVDSWTDGEAKALPLSAYGLISLYRQGCRTFLADGKDYQGFARNRFIAPNLRDLPPIPPALAAFTVPAQVYQAVAQQEDPDNRHIHHIVSAEKDLADRRSIDHSAPEWDGRQWPAGRALSTPVMRTPATADPLPSPVVQSAGLSGDGRNSAWSMASSQPQMDPTYQRGFEQGVYFHYSQSPQYPSTSYTGFDSRMNGGSVATPHQGSGAGYIGWPPSVHVAAGVSSAIGRPYPVQPSGPVQRPDGSPRTPMPPAAPGYRHGQGAGPGR